MSTALTTEIGQKNGPMPVKQLLSCDREIGFAGSPGQSKAACGPDSMVGFTHDLTGLTDDGSVSYA